jgi:hypothetical protein
LFLAVVGSAILRVEDPAFEELGLEDLGLGIVLGE